MNGPTDSREIAPVDIVASLRAIAAEEDRHDLLLLEAANLLDRLTRQNDRLTMELQHRAGQDIERRKRMARRYGTPNPSSVYLDEWRESLP